MYYRKLANKNVDIKFSAYIVWYVSGTTFTRYCLKSKITFSTPCTLSLVHYINSGRGCRGGDHMVVGSTTTYMYTISAFHHSRCEFESRSWRLIDWLIDWLVFNANISNISTMSWCHSWRSVQHYVIKLVSDLRQVGNFLQVIWFRQPIKLTATK
jgi:hypothetical protein